MDDASSQWQDTRVDLSSLAGETVTIAIAADSPEGADPLHGLLLVSNPKVVARDASPLRNVVMVSIDTLRADHMSLCAPGGTAESGIGQRRSQEIQCSCSTFARWDTSKPSPRAPLRPDWPLAQRAHTERG